MTDDVIDDPTRIAQLLASELTGLEAGRLADVTVTDPDRDAKPSPNGTAAYSVEYGGEPIGTVVLYPDAAVVELTDDAPTADDAIRVETGAASKHALDRIRDILAAFDDD
jgi:hypothetical protein